MVTDVPTAPLAGERLLMVGDFPANAVQEKVSTAINIRVADHSLRNVRRWQELTACIPISHPAKEKCREFVCSRINVV